MDAASEVARLEARLEVQHQSRRVDDGKCFFPPAVNFTHWQGVDVRMPYPWCPPSDNAPPALSLDQLAQDRTWPQGRKVAVLPALLVPCCAHSGTTFLWRCMKYAFVPPVVCGRPSRRKHSPNYAGLSTQWTAKACGARKYLLPGLTGNIQGHWDYRKEVRSNRIGDGTTGRK